MANTNNWPFEKPSSSYNWDTLRENTDPWAFEKQEIKLGYINNPYWREKPEFPDVHNPCGYWHKGDPDDTPYVPPPLPPIPKAKIYSAGIADYQCLIRNPDIDQLFFRQIDDTDIFFAVSEVAPIPMTSASGTSLHIKEDHTLWAIGFDSEGALGSGGIHDLPTLTRIGSDNDWADVKTTYSSNHSIALKMDGTIWATGTNNYGQLGLGDTETRYSFTKVGHASDWVYIEAGTFCCFAINRDGLLYSWGYGYHGQLGHGDSENYSRPKLVEGLDQWELISSNYYTTIGLRNNGQLYSTGSNVYGQLCLDIPNPMYHDNITTFTPRTAGDTWKAVANGYKYTILIKQDGSLWGVGHNTRGQLGLGDTSTRYYVTEINSGNWSEIAAGDFHTLCIDENGNLYATGRGLYGVLGLGDTNDRHVLTKVEGTDWNYVDAGLTYSFAGKKVLEP